MKLEHQPLPSKNGDIDWDIVCRNYHDYILSPFAPEMVSLSAAGKSRNLILEHLQTISPSDLSHMSILDLGCGPGNLIPYLAGKAKNLVGVDASQGSIDRAKIVAANHTELNFEGICSNILHLNTDKKYDLIISSNSILPKSRNEVIDLYKKILALLTPNGQLVAILPSFDTTLYLRSLWVDYYSEQKYSEKQIHEIIHTFNESKKLDENTLAYADDGHNAQCYHTKESIIEETKKAGLHLRIPPVKLYYPWNLTKKFDYGCFPNAKEEIWDWFIVAEHT